MNRIIAPEQEPPPLFQSSRYYFTPGVPAGETASIRNAEGEVVLTYRSFASVIGIVASLVLSIVLLSGAAAAVFLIAEERRGAAIAVAVLAVVFATIIAALVPRTRVTLYHDAEPALRIVQRSRFAFPSTTWAVRTPGGTTVGLLRKPALTRLATNRWAIEAPAEARGTAFAAEESFGRALVRKVLGKFRRRFETNIDVFHHGLPAAVIIRRPDERGDANYIEISSASDLDRRVAVALATLIFGLEP